MENYVHRTEGLGAWVLITRIWYKRGYFHRLRLVQRNQFFTGQNNWSFSDHSILKHERSSRVQKNLL